MTPYLAAAETPEKDSATSGRRITYLRAIREAQIAELRRDSSVILLGEDVEASLFGTTLGLLDEFGPERIRNTPISELGFCGAAIGAAMTGLRPIVDMEIASFFWVAMDQIVSQAAKSRYMFGGQATIPVVFRATMFYRVAAAAHHSDRPHSTLMTIPGLKIVAPSGPREAKGLLVSAVRDDDPVLVFEDATLWTSRAEVPEESYSIPLGEANVLRPGKDVTLVAIAGTVPLALRAAEALEEDGISVEVLDPQTLAPLDWPTILGSVAKTGRLVVVDPGHRTCSAASEIVATATEELFDSMSTAPRRIATPDVPIPFAPVLEQPLFPTSEAVAATVRETLG